VQEVVFSEDHVSVTSVPGTTRVELAVSVTLGASPPPLLLLELLEPLPDPPPPHAASADNTKVVSSVLPALSMMISLCSS
jgi:hypothetical protein